MTSPNPSTGMAGSSARVLTERPARYGEQLASHLSHRLVTGWNDATQRGWIELGDGRAELTAVDGALDLRIDAPGDLGRLEDVVGRHLVRFGTRSELVVQWIRDDSTPGSEQRKLEGE